MSTGWVTVTFYCYRTSFPVKMPQSEAWHKRSSYAVLVFNSTVRNNNFKANQTRFYVHLLYEKCWQPEKDAR